jgi:hypothetical protein
MPIVTNKKAPYGSPLVSQRYAPLQDIKFPSEDIHSYKPFYTALLSNRYSLLRYKGLLPCTLRLPHPVGPLLTQMKHHAEGAAPSGSIEQPI